ncbi:hypothetical protein BCR43DRAFT_510689 [Syncephalastrum racemosum]|uniref:Homeobox domain-containing protein n=1 Tax=Syncephalastrum racemosum TaxID=13706 RepID=A0A1X2HVN7_SYNRA|nr:hypothetical protein BCR43DRAFT_510689 [Syncephalastrum racemosum]
MLPRIGSYRSKTPESVQLSTIPKRRARTNEKQAAVLESSFAVDKRPTRQKCEELSGETGISPNSVYYWFQNRRATAKKQRCSEMQPQELSYSSQSEEDQLSADQHEASTTAEDVEHTYDELGSPVRRDAQSRGVIACESVTGEPSSARPRVLYTQPLTELAGQIMPAAPPSSASRSQQQKLSVLPQQPFEQGPRESLTFYSPNVSHQEQRLPSISNLVPENQQEQAQQQQQRQHAQAPYQEQQTQYHQQQFPSAFTRTTEQHTPQSIPSLQSHMAPTEERAPDGRLVYMPPYDFYFHQREYSMEATMLKYLHRNGYYKRA